MDECLKSTLLESQVERCIQIGLLCVQEFAVDRPDMISVSSMLSSDEVIQLKPKEPGFFIERSIHAARSYPSAVEKLENQTMTISDLEA